MNQVDESPSSMLNKLSTVPPLMAGILFVLFLVFASMLSSLSLDQSSTSYRWICEIIIHSPRIVLATMGILILIVWTAGIASYVLTSSKQRNRLMQVVVPLIVPVVAAAFVVWALPSSAIPLACGG